MESSQGSGNVPIGTIVMWSGSITEIPSGWQLCDGTNGSPDLRNRFIVGAGLDFGAGYIANTSEIGSGYFRPGDHGGEGLHLLTIAEMPSHFHLEGAHGPTTIVENMGNGLIYESTKKTAKTSDDSWSTYHPNTQSTGGNQAHSIMPPYFSLAFIIKV